MPIRSIDELRNWAGPECNSASDEEIISMYSRAANIPPTEIARTLGYDPGSGGIGAKELSSSIDKYQAGLYGVGEAVTGAVGLNKASDWLAEQRRANELQGDVAAARAREMGAVDQWKDVNDIGTFGCYAKKLGIQSLPYAAEALGGGLLARSAMSGTRAALASAKTLEEAAAAKKVLAVGETAGGTAASYPSSVGDILSNQREQNGTTNLAAAGVLGVPYAALNALGETGALARRTLPKNPIDFLNSVNGFKGGLARASAAAGKTALEESLGETGQEMLNQAGRMSVDPNETFLNEKSKERFKESAIGGAVLGGLMGGGMGGWRRSGDDVAQSFAQPDVSGTPTTNVAPPVAPTAPTAGIPAATTPPAQTTQAAPTNVAPEQTGQQAAPTEQTVSNAAPTPPAVTGGETAIAQQTQAAAAENAQVEAAQQQQVKRNEALGQFATAYNPEDPTSLKILGQDIVGAPRVTAFGNAFANELTKIPAHGVEIAKAIVQANDATGGKLVSFSFNANNVVGSATKAAQAIGKAATKYQIDHVQSVDEAAQILNKLSMTAKSSQLEHINAIHEALTGKDTEGFIASQTAEGAKNGKQQQNTARVGEVPVQGGAGEASSTGNGTVRSSIVQPVGTGSVPEGSLGLQVGQPSGEGIRNGTSSNAGVGSSLTPPVIGESNGQTNGQTNAAAQIITGLGDGGQIPSQLQQDGAVSTVSSTEKPVRKASEPEVSTTSAILSSLYRAVLTPTQQRKGGASLEQRIDIVRMAVNEQISEEDIAEKTGLPITTVDAQLRRLGIVLRPQLSQATLDERAAIAERLGISPEILQAAFDVDAKNRAKFLSDSITVDVTPEDRARSVSRLVSTMAGQNLQYVIVTPNPETQKDGSIKQYERLDVLFQRAADAYRSPEFPKGIPRRDLLELTEYKNVDVRRSTASELLDEIARGPEQDFDKTKLLAEELYSSEDQDTQSMGTIATAGGSQSEVESQRKAALVDIERLQNKLDATPEEDVAGRENLEKLLRLAFAKYTGGTATEKQATVAALEKEKPTATKATVSEATAAAKAKWKTAKNDLSKLDAGELQLLLDEANKFKNRELAKKIDAELASRTTTTGEKNAVQVKSTNEGNVREPAGGGQEVGKANAEPQKPAREGKAEPKQEAKPEEVIKTPAEEWVTMRAIVPQLPAYNTLDQNEQIRWDDLVHRGTSNLAAAVKIISERLEPTSPVLANNQVQAEGANGTTETVEEETPSFNSRSTKFMEFDELATDVGGVDSVRSDFADLDIEHALDFVSDWNTIDDATPDAFHGQLRVEQGRYIGTLNTAKMVSPAYAAETVRHEVAHAVDMAPHGGVYSHQQEMNLSIVDGKVVPVGEVAKEMFNLYNTDESFRKFLAYPFDISVHTDLDTNGKIESELFAQIFSVYTNPTHMDAFAALAPKTAAYLKEVVNDIRSITTFQVQKSTTAATRALDFRNRYTARRDQGTAPVFGNIGQRIEAFNSRSRGYTPDQVIGKLPPMLQRPTRNIVTNLLHQAKRGLYASAITEDVVSMASKYMKSAQKYLTAQYARQATRLNFEKQIESILSAYDKLPTQLQGDGKGSVNEYIYDATYQKKWGYYPGEHRVGTTLFEVDPDFETRFKAFPPAAQQLIRNVFEHGYQALKLKQRAAQTAVEREFASRVAAAGNDADAIKQIEKEKRLMLAHQTKLTGVEISNPYAYLGRYGDYIVVAKSKEFIAYEDAAKGNEARVSDRGVVGDPQQAKNWLQDNVSNPLHYIVQFAETQAEADEIAAKLQATGNYDVQPEDAGIREAHESYAGNSDMHMAVARLRKLAERNTNTNDAALNKMISDLYLMTVAEASARRSELQRKYVTGADKNMMRNLATSGRADAHFLSTMEHSDEINDSLEAMRDEALRNRRDAMPLYNELYNRYAGSTNYEAPGPLVTGLTRMSTLWYLSTNPAFYLQQVLQTGVLSLPYMAGRLGYFRSARAIKRAYGDMSELVKDLGVTEHVDFDKAPEDIRFMLKALVGMGKIDIGIDADAKARTEEKGVMGTVMHKLQGVNTRIETINRAVAAIAAYRGYIDRYKGATGADGIRYAAEVVSNTHGSYDGFNTPRVLQGGTLKVLLQFKRFQIIQLSMLAKLIHTAFNDASPAEKAVAQASLKYLTAHMAVLGGALAVPFVSQMAWILSKILGDEDEPDDYEYKMRRWIGDEAVADLLLKGVPAALGVDLSGKLGMQNVASILPFADGDLTSRAGAEKILVGIMGPTANLGLKLADSLGMMTKGEYYKGLELALPNGIGNAMKGYRFATEGITMRNGDLVMKPEEVSLLDAAFQAVGLPTAPITDRQYTQRVVMEFDKFYAARSSDIKSSYVQASRNSDSEGMGEARTDWEKLQVSRAANGYKRQPMSDLYKAPAAAAKRERGVVGGVETTKSNRRFVEQVNSVS